MTTKHHRGLTEQRRAGSDDPAAPVPTARDLPITEMAQIGFHFLLRLHSGTGDCFPFWNLHADGQ